ncbi:hypothetical protein Pmani_037522 [Petrolisthes manimaculis]|uniref:Rhodanese domain-containing protein n=1 Tax=Petrolisthes manimaculis TaxID=1843537 RepID=A0AAE1NI42_9EUCA|nr:hypothetical protein Pmani_037522 [Petrolisthes manimaculis]
MSGEDMEFDELASNVGNFVLIDVRNRDEVEQHGQIPGSYCIPLGELEEAMGMEAAEFTAKYGFQRPATGVSLVTHCMKGGRARKAGDLLASHGYKTRVYAGSFNDWKEKEGKIKPGKPFVPDN